MNKNTEIKTTDTNKDKESNGVLRADEILSLLNLLKKRNIEGYELFIIVAQDFKTNEILMVAFADYEAVKKTIETGKVHYFSTSRKKLWLKGEESGNFQFLKELYIDCDGDAILVKVEQLGVACHTGNRSCFYRKIYPK